MYIIHISMKKKTIYIENFKFYRYVSRIEGYNSTEPAEMIERMNKENTIVDEEKTTNHSTNKPKQNIG